MSRHRKPNPRRGYYAAAPTLVVVAVATMLTLLAAYAPEAGAAAPDDSKAAGEPIVATSYGKVRGRNVDGIFAFKGIPYGGSTAGANRFMPPTKPASWQGVRDALEYGNRAPQAVPTTVGDYGKLIGWDKQPGELSEDCLVLNVWTPGSATARNGR